jgi:hypothetical protein
MPDINEVTEIQIIDDDNELDPDVGKKIPPPWVWEKNKKYKTNIEPYLNDIRKWVAKGIPDYEICKKLKINRTSYIEYKKETQQLIDIYSTKKEAIVIGLEKSLYKKAHGLKYKETTKEINKINGEFEPVKEVNKIIMPDTPALIFALKNLAPDKWQDKVSNDTNISVNFQLPDIQNRLKGVLTELENLKAIDITDFEVIDT